MQSNIPIVGGSSADQPLTVVSKGPDGASVGSTIKAWYDWRFLFRFVLFSVPPCAKGIRIVTGSPQRIMPCFDYHGASSEDYGVTFGSVSRSKGLRKDRLDVATGRVARVVRCILHPVPGMAVLRRPDYSLTDL